VVKQIAAFTPEYTEYTERTNPDNQPANLTVL